MCDTEYDSHSEILAGNLDMNNGDNILTELSDDEMEDSVEVESGGDEELTDEFFQDVSLDELKLADKKFEDSFGFKMILNSLIKLLISGTILPMDILCQALVYKIQMLVKGKHSVRYQESYGLFWAGVRNLVKTRGVIPFKEHFSIPSDLGKFRNRIIEICRIDKSLLGKSGIQKSNISNWISEKKAEAKGMSIAVSLTADAKKIASSASGREDLGGLGNSISPSDEEIELRKKSVEWCDILEKLDNKDKCFLLYNHLSEETFKLVTKMSKINELLLKNTKRAEKNSNLLKYVYILNQQKENGSMLINILHELQRDLISEISSHRRCSNYNPVRKSNSVDLGTQPNYYQLHAFQNIKQPQCDRICQLLAKSKKVICFPWDDVKDILELIKTNKRGSKAFQLVYQCCYLKDSMVFAACGLGRKRPLADMKYSYLQAQKEKSSLPDLAQIDQSVVAILLSNFAPMTFGKNRILREGGLFVRNGICAAPELLVYDEINSKVGQFSYD